MSYQVIARKYRPQRFSDVVGQEHVTTTLANAISASRIAHGYLFCGPRGTGKTTLARIFAKCLNCTDGPKVDFDDNDPRVREITEGRSLDVLEIDGASNNGVEQVRELRDTAKFSPAASKFKIYIIDEVHMLTVGAFNALLKTLEEPPAHVKFLFATTDPEKVLPTILSRCQRFDLRRIPSALIVKHLSWIAGQEGVEIDDTALEAVARGADGGMRDAESTLDQLISFCGNRIVEADVLSMFGLAARAQLLSLSDAIIQAQTENALRVLGDLAKGGKDLGRLLGDLSSHFRNLMLYLVCKGDRSVIEVADADFATLTAQSQQIDIAAATRILEVLSTAEGRHRDAGSKRIFMEVTVVKAIQARESTSLDAVLQQLRTLREEASKGEPRSPAAVSPKTPAPQPQPTAVSAPGPAPAPTSGPVVPATPVPTPPAPPTAVIAAPVVPAAAVATPEPPKPAAASPASPMVPSPTALKPEEFGAAEIWNRLLATVGPQEKFLLSWLSTSQAKELAGGIFTIECAPENADLLASSKNIAILETKLKEAGFPTLRVRVVPGKVEEIELTPTMAPTRNGGATPPARPDAKPAAEAKPAKPAIVTLSKDEFLSDPLIKQALELFKGQIIEVRAPGNAEGAA
ncbi:MAG TPA: DNA polymerase III subunit gamma/tau [Candidatus Limnocylindria bacterium]|jgi:DNA polymerase-3 subunit gamma/tau|nr:DNA polymerase III subunit gamma/tau [Candidatus Limnocylindria bacterium]